MAREFTTLRKFVKNALRHLWVGISGVVWSIFGSFTRFRDNFLPDSWKESLQTQRLLHKLPSMTWWGWLIGILLLVIFAVVKSALKQMHERETMFFDASEELARWKSPPPVLQLAVLETIHRRSMETHSYWVGDVFLRVSANLMMPSSLEVEYGLDVILAGRTVPAIWKSDLDRWCRTEIVRNANPLFAGDDLPAYLMDDLTTHLKRGYRVDGWLHFTIEAMPEHELKKCKLRLIAKAPSGTTHVDTDEGTWFVFPQKFKVVLKDDVVEYAGRSPATPLPPPI